MMRRARQRQGEKGLQAMHELSLRPSSSQYKSDFCFAAAFARTSSLSAGITCTEATRKSALKISGASRKGARK